MREQIRSYATRQLAALALAGVLAAPLALATAHTRKIDTVVAGLARVVDGDTIDIAGIRVRLEGIDAPEKGQRCTHRWFGTWACGEAATRHLAQLAESRDVACASRGMDKYGRMLGACRVGDLDINADMVRRGLAWAFVKYSRTYVATEAEARALEIGIWQAPTVTAWEYRAQRWTSAETTAPDGCAIKGNVTTNGRLYHMPWSPWYELTSVDQARGERWFCSEGEAMAAGWRPAIVR